MDQLKAASRELSGKLEAAAPALAATGAMKYAYQASDSSIENDMDWALLRCAVRQYMVADSAGILPLCEQVGQIRPLLLVCDPPVIICNECLSRIEIEATVRPVGHFWDHQCDRCGAHFPGMTGVLLELGHVMISGHICDACAAEDNQRAFQSAEGVVVVAGDRASRRRAERANRKRGNRS